MKFQEFPGNIDPNGPASSGDTERLIAAIYSHPRFRSLEYVLSYGEAALTWRYGSAPVKNIAMEVSAYDTSHL